MLKQKINGHYYNLKNDLRDINLNEARELFGMYKDNASKIDIISLSSNIPFHLLLNMKDEHIDFLYKKLTFLIYDIPYSDFFKLKGRIFHLIDFEKLTIRDYEEIEYYLLNVKNEYESLHRIINVLIKEVKCTSFFNNFLVNILYIKNRMFQKIMVPLTLKKYRCLEYNDNADLFDKYFDAHYALSIYQRFSTWENEIIKEYGIIDEADVITDEERKNLTLEQKSKLAKLEYNPFKQWGIYHIICHLSNSLSERDLWREKTPRELLKYLKYVNLKDKIENV